MKDIRDIVIEGKWHPYAIAILLFIIIILKA